MVQAMDPPPFKLPASPSTPLHPISPERMNQQRALLASPSLPNDLASHLEGKHHHHSRTSSDVQSKVAFINNLSRTSTSTQHQNATTTAALQRAMLGREEAESQLSSTLAQLSEAHVRERKMAERMEGMMEELQTAKERHAHERGVFEKEIRKARKEAFRAGSALVKAQEELKASRGEVRGLREEVARERESKEQAKQEAFERAYTLAGVMEELEELKEKLRTFEADREAARADQEAEALKERVNALQAETEPQERHRVTEEEADAFFAPTPKQEKKLKDALEASTPKSSPRRNRFARRPYEAEAEWKTPAKKWRFPHRRSSLLEDKENVEPEGSESEDEEDIESMQADLEFEKRLRLKAEDMIHFLKMECQFMMCACRIAESQGTRYIHDWEWEKKCQAEAAENTQWFEEEAQRASSRQVDGLNGEHAYQQDLPQSQKSTTPEVEPTPVQEAAPAHTEPVMSFSPTTGTFHTLSSPAAPQDPEAETPQQEHNRGCPQQEDINLYGVSPQKQQLPHHHIAMDITAQQSQQQSPIRQVPPSLPLSSLRALQNERIPKMSDATPVLVSLASPPFSPSPITMPVFKTPTRSLPRNVHAHTTATVGGMRSFTETQTTTTSIVPLRGMDDAEDLFSPMPGTPGTPVSREQALAQIRARRVRARSVAIGGGGGRNLKTTGMRDRDISAPETVRRRDVS